MTNSPARAPGRPSWTTRGPPACQTCELAASEAVDAVGSIFCVSTALRRQLAEMDESLSGHYKKYQDEQKKPVRDDLAKAEQELAAALQVHSDVWRGSWDHCVNTMSPDILNFLICLTFLNVPQIETV